jgi:hypothetical protein
LRKKDKYKRMKPPVTSSRLTEIGESSSLKKHLTMGKVSPSGGGGGGSLSTNESKNTQLKESSYCLHAALAVKLRYGSADKISGAAFPEI